MLLAGVEVDGIVFFETVCNPLKKSREGTKPLKKRGSPVHLEMKEVSGYFSTHIFLRSI